MDADQSPTSPLPPPGRVRLGVEPFVEPLSGLPLLRVRATWDVPLSQPVPQLTLEVRYDGQAASRWPVAAIDAPDVPAGQRRLGAGLQVPREADVRHIEVAIVGPEGEVVLNGETPAAANPPPRMPGVLGRAWRSVLSGEVFSISRWRARLDRLVAKAIALERRLYEKLLARRFRPRSPHDTFVANTAVTPRLWAAMADEAGRFRQKPTFSILMPVFDVDPRWLREAIDSVRNQIYPHWELCLADDASTRPDLRRYLDRLPADPRIKLVRRDTNGHICAATNSAAALATGEFVAFMDNDDALAPDALFAFAELLQHHPDADVIYSDEDKTDAADHRYDPQFKPDWSPELLLSYNYVNHFTGVRRSLFEKAGRFRPGFEGAQDHDLLLRVTELTDRVHHVPRVLYHWRSLPSSTASAAGVKTYVHTASERAVEDALRRRGSRATLYAPHVAQRLGLPIRQLDGPDDGASVAVIIHGPAGAARRTLQALRAATSYRRFTDYFVLDPAAPADALNRLAAARTEEFLLFLEAGAEPTDPRWLSRLMAYATLDGVGVATGRAIHESGAVAAAGAVLAMRDGLGPADAFAGLPTDAVSYYFLAESARNVAVARGRCLLTRRDVFDRLGGFDTRHYPQSLWDVDFSLRIRGFGLRSVYVPGAEFRVSDGPRPADRPTELLALKTTRSREADPFHNPNFSTREPFRPACDGPLPLPREARTPPVRVWAVSHTLNAAEGAPRCLVDIARGLAARGVIAPAVWSPLGGPGEALLRDAGIPTTVTPGPAPRRFVDGLWSPREYRHFQQFARATLGHAKPELVLANTLLAFPLVEAAAALGIPSVWVLHESYSESQLRELFPAYTCRRIEAAFAMAARVVPVSHDAAARYARFNTRGNVRVIHNGLAAAPFDSFRQQTSQADAARRIAAPPGKRVVLAVGTVCERKGQHTLVEAAARLARSRSDFVCYLVGLRDSVPYAEYVRGLVRRHRLENVVRLVPETGDVRPYYRAADVFVNASHLEAYSLSVLEAEAFGLPIVSTPCPGVGEQVVWGANALRFEPSDALGLADALARLLDDPNYCQAMGRESRAMFETHISDREMLDRYADLILAAARTGPRARTPFEPIQAANSNRRAA